MQVIGLGVKPLYWAMVLFCNKGRDGAVTYELKGDNSTHSMEFPPSGVGGCPKLLGWAGLYIYKALDSTFSMRGEGL